MRAQSPLKLLFVIISLHYEAFRVVRVTVCVLLTLMSADVCEYDKS